MAPSRLILLLGVVGLVGCKRDPVFVGYWDVAKVTYAGDTVADAGFMDFDGDGNVTMLSRYVHLGAGWEPVAQPSTVESPCDVFTQEDVFEAYQEEGEVFDLSIQALQMEPMRLVDYHPGRAEVSGPEVLWPGNAQAGAVRFVLRR